eukprot:4220334-Amphidinium_carterae.1
MGASWFRIVSSQSMQKPSCTCKEGAAILEIQQEHATKTTFTKIDGRFILNKRHYYKVEVMDG